MSNENKHRRITDPQLRQPHEFITATGYGNAIFHLDTNRVSLQVSSAKKNNLKIEQGGSVKK